MKFLLVDESKSKKYVLAVVQIEGADTKLARRVLSDLRMKGQHYIHFVNEGASRKRRILSAISEINFQCTFLVSEMKNEKQARQECLIALVKSLNESEEYLIIFDSDDNHIVNDKKVIRSALQESGLTTSVTYRHERSRSQPLLWLPDILAWSFARSGVWSKSLSRFEIRVQRLQ